MLGLVKDTRRDKVFDASLEAKDKVLAEDDLLEACYLCWEMVLPGPDYQVHLTTAHEEVTLAAQEDEKEEEEVIEDPAQEEEEEDVIEDPVACYLCGETVLPGQDYKVHLAAAHRLTKV